MTTEGTTRLQDDKEAGRIDARLRKSVRLSIWKMLLRRIMPVVGGFVILGLVLLEMVKRFLPTSGTLQSPAVVLLAQPRRLPLAAGWAARFNLALPFTQHVTRNKEPWHSSCIHLPKRK